MSEKESRPRLGETQASQLIERLFGLNVQKIRPLPSYDDQNFHVVASEGGEYVLKIMNAEFSRSPDLYELQNWILGFMHQHGLPTQTPLTNVSGKTMSMEEIDTGSGSQKHLVRLLTYLPGITISKVPYTPEILYQVGKMAATMDTIFDQMEHPKLWVLQRKDFLWNLGNLHLLESYLPIFQEEEELQAMKSILNMFRTEVVPNIHLFRKCINHGDLNDLNILVVPDGPTGHRISGILDLGDMSAGCYVYELAINIMYMMIESPNPMDVAGPLIAGWQSVLPLNEAERDALYVLVLARFCQSTVLGQHAVAKDPENIDYLSITSRKGKGHLLMLLKMGKEAVHRKWFEDAWEYSGRK